MDTEFLKCPNKEETLFEAMEAAYPLAQQLMNFASLVLPWSIFRDSYIKHKYVTCCKKP